MPLKVSHGIGAWIKDFQKSDAPQFKGKSDKERRDQAIAAYLSAKRDQKEAKEPPPFEGPYKKKKSVVPGKHGEGPSTAKHLAKMGMKQAEKKPVKEASAAYSAVTNPLKWAADKEKAKKQSTLTHSDRNKLGQLAQMLAKEKKPTKEETVGLERAKKRLGEDVNESEQLDELSPGLLGRYTRARGSLNITKKQSKMKARAHQKMRDKTKDLSAIAGKYSNPADLTKVEATTFEVDIEGLPKMYIKDKSPGAVKAKLRGIVKQPSMIQGVDRVTDAEMKKTYRDKAQGREEEMDEGTIDEGLKSKLGTAALAGALALGAAGGAHARVKPGDDPNINRLTGKPNVTHVVKHDQTKKATPFSKEYLKKVANDEHPRPLINKDKAKELLKKHYNESVNEISGELAQRYHDKAVKAPAPKDKKDPLKHTIKRFASMQKAQDIIHKSELKRIGGQK